MKHLLSLPFLVLATPLFADPATVEDVTLRETGGSYTVSVTIRHGDTGWDDYADGWRVEDADGEVLGFRELLHPHVNEQPFTRSLSGVVIPVGLAEVFVRARTNTDGWAETTTPVPLN
ncbi:MAG: hypothetical protein AAGF74_17485 [Pseudomonadota bacterium]